MSYLIGVSFFRVGLDTRIVLGSGLAMLNLTVGLARSHSDSKTEALGNAVDLETKFNHVDNQSITCM